MKVSDIMQEQVESVSPQASVRDVSRLIFGRGINGVPVCEGRKIVGFVTEKDILAKFYPTMEEYIEDASLATDFEGMEGKTLEILSMPVTKIMSKTPTTVSASTPVLRAQSLMSSHKLSRLPVVDSEGNLIGILSRGDIFRGVVGQKLPFEREEEFYDWLARDYDLLIDWSARLGNEIPAILSVLKKNNATRVIDVASSTGEHAIALAKEGINVYGIETSSNMQKLSEEKKKHLPEALSSRVSFIPGEYRESTKKLPGDIPAAIFMGNALSHVFYTEQNILEDVAAALSKESVLIFQLVNSDKVLAGGGVQDFVFRQSLHPYQQKHLFFSFYYKVDSRTIMLTRIVFDYEKNRWVYRRINNTPIAYITKDSLTKMLKQIGFTSISYYGGTFGDPLFKKEFDPETSDWLNVVAKRG